MKIAYCLDSISRIGGIEKITVLKANALAEIEGNEVFIIVADHFSGCGYADLLSIKVKMVNLDVCYYDTNWKTRLSGNIGLIKKKRHHKHLLRKVLFDIQPDIVISTGLLEKFILPEIKGNWITVREFHFPKNYRVLAYNGRSFFYKFVERLADLYEYGWQLRKYDHIVILTNEDKERNWTDTDSLSVIPNFIIPIDESNIIPQKDVRKVIAVGRLTAQKNFSSLIRAFRMVVDLHPDWILEIYGNGQELTMLQSLIKKLHLKKYINLYGNTLNVQNKMCNSSIFVLSSIFEGFGLVITEAMSCGLPVVSYTCPCGPKDIITDGVDGFLVSTGDEQMLADKICYLIENPDIRMKMGTAALKKSENYHIEKIIPMWMNLFERLLTEKRLHQ